MIRLPTAVVGIAALVAGAAHAQPNNPNANKNPDQSFVDRAAAGEIAEVDAAKLALQKSHNAKVRRFAQRMVSDHAKANEKLEALAQKEGASVPNRPSAADLEKMTRLQGLTGRDFDNVYVRDPLTAHQQAVGLFTGESESGKDAQLKRFATATLPTLREHLKMVQTMVPRT